MATITGAIIQAAGFRPGASGILFQSDNAADIGATAANRPRDLNLGRNAAIGGTLAVTGAVSLSSTLSAKASTLAWVKRQGLTYTPGDTTPSVLDVSFLDITNSVPTTITQLDDAVSFQVVTLRFNDANTTITRANMFLSGGVDFVSTANDTLTLLKIGTQWFELARAVAS